MLVREKVYMQHRMTRTIFLSQPCISQLHKPGPLETWTTCLAPGRGSGKPIGGEGKFHHHLRRIVEKVTITKATVIGSAISRSETRATIVALWGGMAEAEYVEKDKADASIR